MRLVRWSLVATLLAACGGGGSPSDPVTPPPPPGGTVPASLAVQAGDNQQGAPSTAVAAAPTVAIKDAQGRGVANVTVTFRVDSGNGALQSATAVTGSDGTASAGTWTLGPAEGRNVVVASAGALTPVKFVAMAVAATSVTQNVGPGGGAITVLTGPLAGTKVTIPGGAFAGNVTWTIEAKPLASWPARAGVTPVGTVVHLATSDTASVGAGLQLTLPFTAPAGTKPFILMRDPNGTAMEVLPTVTAENGLITINTQHFDPSRLGTGTSAGVRGASIRTTGYDVDVVVSTIPVAQLDGDIDTGFRPGVDDWDFPMLPTSFIIVAGASSSPVEVGATLSQMAYFAGGKTRGNLYKKYREIDEIPLSNKVGFRDAAYVAYNAQTPKLITSIRTIRTSMRAGQADQTFYDVLKANMIVTRLPQMMVANVGNTWVPLTAFRTTGGKIDFGNPFKPGETGSVTFAGGQFASTPIVADIDGHMVTPEWFGSTSIAQWINTSKIVTDLNTFAEGKQPGGTNFWPATVLGARGATAVDTTLYVLDDTTRFFFTCEKCKVKMPSPLDAQGIEPFSGYGRNGSTLVSYEGLSNLGKFVQQTTAVDARIGVVKFESADGVNVSWLDFEWIHVYRWKMTLPANMTAALGSTSFTATVDGLARPDSRFVWTFGSGLDVITQTTTTPTVTTTFTKVGTIPVLLEMVRNSDGKVIARTRGSVAVGNPLPIYRVTSVSVQITGPAYTNTEKSVLYPIIGVYASDSARWTRVRNGQMDAGYAFVPADTTAYSKLHRRGMYEMMGFVEGDSVTKLPLPDFPNNMTMIASAIQAGKIATNPEYNSSYSDGSATPFAGTLQATIWGTTYDTNVPQMVSFYSISWVGTTMNGTIRKVYEARGGANWQVVNKSWTIQVNFTATRIR